MKATELMIGDWLRYSPKSISLNNNYGGPYRVEGVSQDTISLGAKNYRFVVSDKEIDPIPLTPEILEKNGWNHSNRLMITRIDDNDFYWSEELGGILYKNQYNMCNCKYVHNLQHALRLCGLDELADNFKI